MNKLVLLQYDSSDFFVDLCVEINYEQDICIGTTMACSRLATVSNAPSHAIILSSTYFLLTITLFKTNL